MPEQSSDPLILPADPPDPGPAAAGGDPTAQTVQPADAGDPIGPGEIPLAQWAAVPLAVAVLVVLARRGALSPARLARGPLRQVPLTWFDLGAGVLLFLGGQMVAAGALQSGFGESTLVSPEPEAVAIRMIVLQVLGMGPAVAWFVMRCAQGEAGLRRAGIVPRRPGRDVKLSLLALPVAVLLVLATMTLSAVAAWAMGYPTQAVQHDLLETYTREMPVWVFALLLTSTVVFAPFFEEFIFRGLLQTTALQYLGHERRWWVILAASVFFASIHMGAVAWTALPALVLLGVFFGCLYERTGSLWPCVLVHAGFNAFNVAVVLAADAAGLAP